MCAMCIHTYMNVHVILHAIHADKSVIIISMNMHYSLVPFVSRPHPPFDHQA